MGNPVRKAAKRNSLSSRANRKKKKGLSYGTNLAVRNLTRARVPRLDWVKPKNKILGKNYDLSLVFVGEKEMARLNERRGKKVPTNVLSFALGEKTGEVFIAPKVAYKEAKELSAKSGSAPGGKIFAEKRFMELYIHALLHLKGFKHDTKKNFKIMESAEQKWLKILS